MPWRWPTATRGGGPAGARTSLGKFRHALGSGALMGGMRPTPFDALRGGGSIETSPAYVQLQLASATLSPGVLNPLARSSTWPAVDEETGARVHLGAVRLHAISGTGILRDMSISSKFNTDMGFILHLKNLGRAAAERWLKEDFEGVGIASTFDPAHVYAPETLETRLQA